MLVAFPILALDEIGVELQNPFSSGRLNHLPLDEICENLERNLMALLADFDARGDGVADAGDGRYPPATSPRPAGMGRLEAHHRRFQVRRANRRIDRGLSSRPRGVGCQPCVESRAS